MPPGKSDLRAALSIEVVEQSDKQEEAKAEADLGLHIICKAEVDSQTESKTGPRPKEPQEDAQNEPQIQVRVEGQTHVKAKPRLDLSWMDRFTCSLLYGSNFLENYHLICMNIDASVASN